MISCSHWGMFELLPTPINMSVNNFHGAMQVANLASAANSINKMYENLATGQRISHGWR